jgi:hypothetical protein
MNQVDSKPPFHFLVAFVHLPKLDHLHLEKVDQVVLLHLLMLHNAPALVDAFANANTASDIGTSSRWRRHRRR